MPKFTYTGDDERYYPELGYAAAPGCPDQTFDREPGDGRWEQVEAKSKSKSDPPADLPVRPTATKDQE